MLGSDWVGLWDWVAGGGNLLDSRDESVPTYFHTYLYLTRYNFRIYISSNVLLAAWCACRDGWCLLWLVISTGRDRLGKEGGRSRLGFVISVSVFGLRMVFLYGVKVHYLVRTWPDMLATALYLMLTINPLPPCQAGCSLRMSHLIHHYSPTHGPRDSSQLKGVHT